MSHPPSQLYHRYDQQSNLDREHEGAPNEPIAYDDEQELLDIMQLVQNGSHLENPEDFLQRSLILERYLQERRAWALQESARLDAMLELGFTLNPGDIPAACGLMLSFVMEPSTDEGGNEGEEGYEEEEEEEGDSNGDDATEGLEDNGIAHQGQRKPRKPRRPYTVTCALL
ncbi:hypothetical protein FS749_012770 [Ceratobasidium sp. UAMH 11750]|nr:hypothetical protein FS749_012770 [Ceratobasidium sp. UAMH 11750]